MSTVSTTPNNQLSKELRRNVIYSILCVLVIVGVHILRAPEFKAIIDTAVFWTIDIASALAAFIFFGINISQAPKGGSDDVFEIGAWILTIINAGWVLSFVAGALDRV